MLVICQYPERGRRLPRGDDIQGRRARLLHTDRASRPDGKGLPVDAIEDTRAPKFTDSRAAPAALVALGAATGFLKTITPPSERNRSIRIHRHPASLLELHGGSDASMRVTLRPGASTRSPLACASDAQASQAKITLENDNSFSPGKLPGRDVMAFCALRPAAAQEKSL